MFRFSQPLMFPDVPAADPVAAVVDAAKTAADAATAAAKDTPKLKIGGREYTQAEADALATRSTQADSFKNAVQHLFDASKPLAEREAKSREALGALGYNRQQIDAWVATNLADAATTDDDVVTTPATETATDAINKRLDSLDNSQRESRRLQLEAAFTKNVNDALDSDPQMKLLLAAASRLRGDAKVTDIKSKIEKALRKESLNRFRTKINTTGQALHESWMGGEVSEAVKEVVDQFSAVIGDPSLVGRGSETGTPGHTLLTREPLKAPKYTEGKTLGDLETEVTAWMSDGLSRSALEMSGSGSKV